MEHMSIHKRSEKLVGFVEGTMIGAGEHCVRAARDLGLLPVFFSTNPDRYTFLSKYDCVVIKVASIDPATLSDCITAMEQNRGCRFVGFGTTDDSALSSVRDLCKARDLPCVPEIGLGNCRNKAITREILRHQSPKFERITSDVDPAQVLGQFTGDIIVKPVDGTSGVGVKRCRSSKEAMRHVQALMSHPEDTGDAPNSQVLVEEFLEGQEVSVEVFNGRAFGVTQIEIDDTCGFVEVCHLHPANMPAPLTARLKAMVEEAVAMTGLTWGPAHIQYRVVADRPYLIEINPRLGGGNATQCVEYASGIRLAHAYVRLISGMDDVRSELHRHVDQYACVRFSLTEDDQPIREIAGLELALQATGIVETGTRARVGHIYPPIGSNHDRLTFAIATADSPEIAMNYAREAAKTIEIRHVSRQKARHA